MDARAPGRLGGEDGAGHRHARGDGDARAAPPASQAYRTCLGILRLGKHYGDARLEAACRRALTLGTHRYRSIASILEHRLDQAPTTLALDLDSAAPLEHDNIRGAAYYH